MTIIILLIITGLLLLILEFFVVPGITVAGIGGIGMIVGGIFMAYGIDTTTGHITLAVTISSTLIILVFALRTNTWKKLMLNSSITSHVDSVEENTINIGDKGKTISRLNPMGKVRVNGQDVEARCPSQFLDPKMEIEVTEVFKTYIIVKPVK
jgi:membrane-bound ClpP family serine protease